MFDALMFLEMAFAGAMAVSQPVLLQTTEQISFVQKVGAVFPTELTQVRALISGPGDGCRYSGVAVSYARDWEDVQNQGELTERRLPPEPNKPIGLAFMIDKKICPDKEPESVALMAEHPYLFAFKGHKVNAKDLNTTPKEQQPKWFPQVMKAITDKAGELTEKQAADKS